MVKAIIKVVAAAITTREAGIMAATAVEATRTVAEETVGTTIEAEVTTKASTVLLVTHLPMPSGKSSSGRSRCD